MPFSCIRWLSGIQAQAAALRPVPPTCSAASSRMVDGPSSAAFTAVLNPATEAPTTTTSASPSHRVSPSTVRLISPMAALPSRMTVATLDRRALTGLTRSARRLRSCAQSCCGSCRTGTLPRGGRGDREMSLIIATSQLAPSERFDLWVEEAWKAYFPMSFERGGGSAFSGVAHNCELGPVDVHRVMAGPSGLLRTRRNIDAADPETFHLGLELRGHSRMEQDGRSCAMPTGTLFG